MDWIRRLYASDARGLRDSDLLREVGWALYARAQSVLDANRAHDRHIARCPRCGSDAHLTSEPHTPSSAFVCACGWRMDWDDYHATYRRKQLTGSSIVPFVDEFMRAFRAARDDEDAQMRAIDTLLHRFHWELEGLSARPVAVNFIEGRLPEVFHLMCELAHADTPAWQQERSRWEHNVALFRNIWKEL
ncbi:MAG: hypothetical protein ACI4L8_12080 [Candidatus Fimadaptatus sp.]